MMDHQEIHLILVADEHESLLYNHFLTARGVTFYTIRGRNQIENILEIIPINGIIVDTATDKTRQPSEELYLKEMRQLYPLLYTKIDEKAQKPVTDLSRNIKGPELDEFIFEKCAGVPRLMRTSQRKALHLNVMLCSDLQFTNDVEKSCTYDVSDTGLFVITSNPKWHEGDLVAIVINELTQRTPIQGTIVRVIEWGVKPTVPPGISIRFDAILDSQQDELFRFLQG